MIMLGITKMQLMINSKGNKSVMITAATAGRRATPFASFMTFTVRKKLKRPLMKAVASS